jgi:hypothetical protein
MTMSRKVHTDDGSFDAVRSRLQDAEESKAPTGLPRLALATRIG